jgi:hypothetical protein
MLGSPPPTSPSPVRELPATPEALRHSALSQKSARTRRAYRLDVQHLMRTQQRSDIPEEQIWLDKHHRYRRPVAPRLCAVCVGHRCDRPRPVPGVDAPCPGTKSSNPSSSSAESATNLVAAGGVVRGWDPEFESTLLQRRVHCEPDFSHARSRLKDETNYRCSLVREAGPPRTKEFDFGPLPARSLAAANVDRCLNPGQSRYPAGASCAPNAGRTVRT